MNGFFAMRRTYDGRALYWGRAGSRWGWFASKRLAVVFSTREAAEARGEDFNGWAVAVKVLERPPVAVECPSATAEGLFFGSYT